MKNRRKRTYEFGLWAEQLACFWLMLKGYRIISKRYKNHQGEIDILATKGKVLAAVEVKARASFDECFDAVPPWKQRKIIRAMEGLMMERSKIAGLAGVHTRNIRFDVVWIVRGYLPRHIKDAWRA